MRKNFIIVLIVLIFDVFLSDRGVSFHSRINEDIQKLEQEKQLYATLIEEVKMQDSLIRTPSGLEKFCRERYYFKKEKEDVFIIIH